MTMVYATLAVIGGTVMICQLVMTLLGMSHGDGDFASQGGGDFHGAAGDLHSGEMHTGDTHPAGSDSADTHAADGHAAPHHPVPASTHDATWIFGIITFRTVTAAITFFGLTGLAANSAQIVPRQTFALALGAGGAAMLLVHQMMQLLFKLRSDGTARIEGALGRQGTVYLRVPARGQGVGKVTIDLQGRSMEYLAISQGPSFATGAKIVVTRIASSDTVEVDRVAVESQEANYA